jgi:hypothetical protein
VKLTEDYTDLEVNVSPHFLFLYKKMTLTESLSSLRSSPEAYGIIVGDSREIQGLIKLEDIEHLIISNTAKDECSYMTLEMASIWRPPLLIMIVGEEEPHQVKIPSYFIELGARGIILIDKDQRIIGVMGIKTRRVTQGPEKPKEDYLPFKGLNGNPIVPRGTIFCTTCGFGNKLNYFDPKNPPNCKNLNCAYGPHKIR